MNLYRNGTDDAQVQAPGGKPSMRLPIDQFQSQQPFAFALYVQALLAWQQAGSPTVDPDNVNGTSYFQIAGMSFINSHRWTC
jgi:hypothetical protein